MKKLTRAEMLELVEKLMNGEIGEDRTEEVVDALERSTNNPHIIDLIFYPEVEGMTAEEIVSKALEYRPIEL
ncbi:bacteriocin immunity protein [Actinosynnema sp. CA-248983]